MKKQSQKNKNSVKIQNERLKTPYTTKYVKKESIGRNSRSVTPEMAYYSVPTTQKQHSHSCLEELEYPNSISKGFQTSPLHTKIQTEMQRSTLRTPQPKSHVGYRRRISNQTDFLKEFSSHEKIKVQNSNEENEKFPSFEVSRKQDSEIFNQSNQKVFLLFTKLDIWQSCLNSQQDYKGNLLSNPSN